MKTIKILTLAVLCSINLACEKYLDVKPDIRLSTIASLDDLQQILDNYSIMNSQFPSVIEVVADDYYLETTAWESRNETQRNQHIWMPYDGDNMNWLSAYHTVFHANNVIDNIGRFGTDADRRRAQQLEGGALFFRAYQFFILAQLYAKPFDARTAHEDMGIPLRLSADFNVASARGTLLQTYTQIVNDLKKAAQLLPESVSLKTRPGKAAAYGALARVYLSMSEYDLAGRYADSCLQLYDTLLDYNKLDAEASAPIQQFNDEVVMQLLSPSNSILAGSRAKIDTTLYRMYDDDDLRKSVLFTENGDGSHRFKGDYDGRGVGYAFLGIVTDEMYLIRAESAIRNGEIERGLEDLNWLLKHRFKTGSSNGAVFNVDQAGALELVLRERRKELLFRGARWIDLRRLMVSGELDYTPQRKIDGQLYKLTAKKSNYTLLIPARVIERTNIPQNDQ